MSVSKRVIKGTAWLSAARAIANALAVLSTIVLARLLSPEDFGLIAVATTLMLVITEVTELSLSQALVRHAAPTREHFDTAWTLNALRASLLAIAFVAAGPFVAQIYKDERLVGVITALGCSMFIGGLANPRRVLLTRQLIFWQEFVLGVGQKLAGVVASIVVAFVYQSYWALVIGVLVTQATNVLISYTVLPFMPRPRLTHGKDLLSFSLWLTAVQIVNTLNWRFDTLFVGKVLGNVALGHYSVGSTLAAIPTRETTGPLRQTFFPAFSTMRDDAPRLTAAYQRAQAAVTAVALPAGIGAALVADPLIRLTMGDKWVPAIFIVQALALVYALQTLGSSVEPLGMAKGQPRLLFVRSFQMLLIRLPVVVGALLMFGMAGLVAARVFTGLLAALVNMALVRRLIGLPIMEQLRANSRALSSAAVMCAAALAVGHLLPDRSDALGLSIELVAIGTMALLSYGVATLWLWNRAGRPAGPEQDILQLLVRIKTKIFPRPA